MTGYLTGHQAAARAGITYNAWKLARRFARPAPDQTRVYDGRRIQLWRPETVDAWVAQRRPSHAEILANERAGEPQRVHYRTVRRHLRLHSERACACFATPDRDPRLRI